METRGRSRRICMFLADMSVSGCFLVQMFVATCQLLLETLLSLREEFGSGQALVMVPEERRKNVIMLLEAAISSLFSQSAAT